MTTLTPVNELTAVPQLERTTVAEGGAGRPMNTQAQALLNRIQYVLDTLLPLKADLAKAVLLLSDTDSGQTLVDAAQQPVSLDNAPAPAGATAIGDTIGDVLSALAEGLHDVIQTPNQVLITFNTDGTATFSLPQDIGLTSSPQFATLKASHLQGMTVKPTVALGTGAGTAATLDLVHGSDMMFRVDLTTGSAPVAGATIFSLTYATTYGAIPPLVMLVPFNRRAWDGQNTANKAVAVDVAESTGAMAVVKAGTTALTAATQYSWIGFTSVRSA